MLHLHRSGQLKLNFDVNWTITLSQNQVRASVKQNGIGWCQKCNKPGAIRRKERDLLKGYQLRTNYVKNTISVSSCDFEQVTPTKYLNQKYLIPIKEIVTTLHVSCFIKVDNNKTRMKWNKILVSNIMTLSERLKSGQVWLSWAEW